MVMYMKRLIKICLCVWICFLLTGCRKEYLQEISYQDYLNLLESKETFILEVMRTDCSACSSFKPKLTQVADDYKLEIKFINTDHLSDEDKKALFNQASISGTPTVIFYHDGVEKTISSRINGSVSVDKIISKFKLNGFIEEE